MMETLTDPATTFADEPLDEPIAEPEAKEDDGDEKALTLYHVFHQRPEDDAYVGVGTWPANGPKLAIKEAREANDPERHIARWFATPARNWKGMEFTTRTVTIDEEREII